MKAKYFLTTMIAVGATLAMASTAVAAPPGILVEGVLLAKGGGPVADGAYTVEFAIYDKETGGVKVWSEAAKLTVSKGAFTHALGSVAQLLPAVVAKLNQPWLTAKVEQDPELPRRRMHAVAWAFSAQTAHGIACTGCVGTSALKADGDLDLGAFALKAGKITAKDGTFTAIVAGSFVGDGSKLTGIKTAAGVCKAGQVMTGIAADGSVKCGQAIDIKNLPANALTAFSGGSLSNQFADKFASDANRNIKDNFPSGMTDTIDVPDLGVAESIKVSINVAGTSGIAGLRVLLYDPSFGPLPADISKNGASDKASVVLHDKSGAGPNLIASYPPASPAKGDLNGWVGKNPKGKWSLVLIDTQFKDNQSDGKLVTWSLEVNTVSHTKVQSTGTLIATGGFQLPVLAKSPYPCTPKWRGFTFVNEKTDAVHICRKSGLWGTFSIHECGNKIVEIGESCDDGNHTPDDGCDALCVKECGNGKVDKNEECDVNDPATKAMCLPTCKKLSYGKRWLNTPTYDFFPVKYVHSTYKESLAIATCKSVGMRLWRDESGPSNDPNYAYDYQGNHNLGGHDICYKVNSATSGQQQGHTGTWMVFSTNWSNDIKLISGASNGQSVYIFNKEAHGGSNENSSSYCEIRPNASSVSWVTQTNGNKTGLKDNAIVLCSKTK